jgi:hypothetical protein
MTVPGQGVFDEDRVVSSRVEAAPGLEGDDDVGEVSATFEVEVTDPDVLTVAVHSAGASDRRG